MGVLKYDDFCLVGDGKAVNTNNWFVLRFVKRMVARGRGGDGACKDSIRNA